VSIFFIFLRDTLEHVKLTKILQEKRLNILCHVKIQWISMLAPTKCILIKYKNLVVKMFEDQLAKNVIAKLNYELLCNHDIILRLICLLSMLEVMQSLFKLALGKNAFVCNLVNSLVLHIIELYAMYLNILQRYDQS
jgi:hypothetical protein